MLESIFLKNQIFGKLKLVRLVKVNALFTALFGLLGYFYTASPSIPLKLILIIYSLGMGIFGVELLSLFNKQKIPKKWCVRLLILFVIQLLIICWLFLS